MFYIVTVFPAARIGIKLLEEMAVRIPLVTLILE